MLQHKCVSIADGRNAAVRHDSAQTTRGAYLDLGGGPSPGEGVQQCNAAEEHVVSLIAAAKGGKVAAIGQGHRCMAIARAGRLSFYLRGVLSPLPGLSVQGVHLVERQGSNSECPKALLEQGSPPGSSADSHAPVCNALAMFFIK